MRQFRVVTHASLDGVSASLPSLRECESWGATEDEALANLMERIAWYFNLPANFKHTLDRLRREDDDTHYTLIVKD